MVPCGKTSVVTPTTGSRNRILSCLFQQPMVATIKKTIFSMFSVVSHPNSLKVNLEFMEVGGRLEHLMVLSMESSFFF